VQPTGQLALSATPRVLIFGDSYTEGYGATPRTQGFAYRVGAGLDWRVTVDGAGGSGYIADGPQNQGNYLSRLPAAPPGPFDLVVLQGSSNDQGQPDASLRAAVSATVSSFRAKYPTAQLAMMGPVAVYGHGDPRRIRLNGVMSAFAREQHVPYLSPMDEHWFVQGTSSTYVNVAVGHPNNAGYGRIADLFVADMQLITRRTAAGCS